MAVPAITAETLDAADYGVQPGGKDCGAAMLKLLDSARSRDADTIRFAPGEYHFHQESARSMQLYISNHDQQPSHPVAIPVTGMRKLKLEGNDTRFVFHGMMLPVVIMDSSQIEISDISIDYAEPYSSEGRIVEIKNGTTTLEMSQASRYTVADGVFLLTSNGRRARVQCALAFEPDGRMVPTGRSGDIVWPSVCESLPGNRVRFAINAAQRGLSVGQTLVLRNYARPCFLKLNTTYNKLYFNILQIVFCNLRSLNTQIVTSENVFPRRALQTAVVSVPSMSLTRPVHRGLA